MATSMVMSRAVSAAGSASGRISNLPVIQHPMSRMGDAQDLNIRGSSSIALRRENTVVTIRSGRAEFGNNHGAHNHMRKSAPERIVQWPPACEPKAPYTYQKIPRQILPPISDAASERTEITAELHLTALATGKENKYPILKYPILPSIPRKHGLRAFEELEGYAVTSA